MNAALSESGSAAKEVKDEGRYQVAKGEKHEVCRHFDAFNALSRKRGRRGATGGGQSVMSQRNCAGDQVQADRC